MIYFWEWNDGSYLVERRNGKDFLIVSKDMGKLTSYVFATHGTLGRPRPISEMDDGDEECKYTLAFE